MCLQQCSTLKRKAMSCSYPTQPKFKWQTCQTQKLSLPDKIKTCATQHLLNSICRQTRHHQRKHLSGRTLMPSTMGQTNHPHLFLGYTTIMVMVKYSCEPLSGESWRQNPTSQQTKKPMVYMIMVLVRRFSKTKSSAHKKIKQ